MSAEETSASTPTAPPTLRIVSGRPTDEDIAVLVAVLGSAGGPRGTTGPTGPRDLWGTPTDRLRPAWPSTPNSFINLRFDY